jgi:hypothetical protein
METEKEKNTRGADQMKTIETTIRVRVQVCTDTDIDLPDQQMKDAARQAVENALRFGEDVGFEHPLAAQVSIGVGAVELG